MKVRISLALAAAFALLAPAAAAQQPPAQPAPQKAKEQPKPKPKAKRVWSEEEVKELRKPWDQVEEEKKEEAKPGAAADAKAAGPEAAKPEGEAVDPDAPILPKTVEEADKMLEYKNTEVRAQQELVAELQRALYDEASTESREDLKQKIEKARIKLRESQDEYKRINTARQELRAKKEGEAPPPTKPPSQ